MLFFSRHFFELCNGHIRKSHREKKLACEDLGVGSDRAGNDRGRELKKFGYFFFKVRVKKCGRVKKNE